MPLTAYPWYLLYSPPDLFVIEILHAMIASFNNFVYVFTAFYASSVVQHHDVYDIHVHI